MAVALLARGVLIWDKKSKQFLICANNLGNKISHDQMLIKYADKNTRPDPGVSPLMAISCIEG